MVPRSLTLVAVLAGCLAAAPAAPGAGWQRVTTPDGSSIDEAGIARTADGTLHVAWHHPTGPNSEDLMHTAITPAGKLGATSPIQTGWATLTDPALVSTPAGLTVLFGGIRTTDPGEPNQELNAASSADGGTTWALQPGSVVPGGAQSYGSDMAATTLADGTILQAWAGTLGTWTHAGLSPVAPNHNHQDGLGCCGYDPGIATDATGQTMLAWFSNASANTGVLARAVAADGSPAGSLMRMPGTEKHTGTLARTALVARPGGGFYVAYPTGYPALKEVRLWRVGSNSAPVVARLSGSGNQHATVAAATDGRLWIAWVSNAGGAPQVYAARSNRSATRFGASVPAGHPKDSHATTALDGSPAPDGGLDLLAVFGIGTTPKAATYHQRVLPGLTLAAKPAKLRSGVAAKVSFTVTDAGDAVKGARVSAAGASGKTDAKGRVTLTLRPRSTQRITATAALEDYVSASVRVSVRR